MASESDIQQLTEFEDNDRLDELGDRAPDDAVEFDLYYDGRVVNPWSKGPNELVRLYFNDDERGDSYIPINNPENIEEGVRSTPIGRPMRDDNDDQSRDQPESWDDLDGEFELEQNVEIAGHAFDLLWQSNGGEKQVIVATEFDDAEA